MMTLDHFTSKLAAVFALLFFIFIHDVKAQKTTGLSGATIRAAKGDTVWVILNHIKPEKRNVFEKFIQEILMPQAAKLSPADQQAFKQVRVLYPAMMNEDSTFTYVFLVDPVIPQANYSILDALKKMYGEDKAVEYLKMFTESLAAPQKVYAVIQSQY
jgi:hypothetical protein